MDNLTNIFKMEDNIDKVIASLRLLQYNYEVFASNDSLRQQITNHALGLSISSNNLQRAINEFEHFLGEIQSVQNKYNSADLWGSLHDKFFHAFKQPKARPIKECLAPFFPHISFVEVREFVRVTNSVQESDDLDEVIHNTIREHQKQSSVFASRIPSELLTQFDSESFIVRDANEDANYVYIEKKKVYGTGLIKRKDRGMLSEEEYYAYVKDIIINHLFVAIVYFMEFE